MRPEQERDYEEFVRSSLPRLHRTAYLLCGDGHRADDIVQAALTSLFVHWKKASRADDINGYAHRVLMRRYVDDRRLRWSRVRLGELPSDVATVTGADHGVGQEQEELMTALQSLPKRRRAAIVLRYLDDLSVEQTAEMLGCTVSTVKSQCSRGLATLRQLLGDMEHVGLGGRE